MSARPTRPCVLAPAGKPMTRRQKLALRQRLEAAIAQALDVLDALDGDPDLEDGADDEPVLSVPEVGGGYSWRARGQPVFVPRLDDAKRWAEGNDVGEREDVSEDEGGACEDEGADTGDREPDSVDWPCNWQDEGDQTVIRQLPYGASRNPHMRSQHSNVGPLVRVRELPGGTLTIRR